MAPITGGAPAAWRPECVAAGMLAWSPDSDRVVFGGDCGQRQEAIIARDLFLIPRAAGSAQLIGPLLDRDIELPRLAWARLRDGSDTIVVPRRAGDNVNLFRVKLDGGLVPLTSGAGLEHWPVVSPSGELIFTRTDVRPSVWSLPIVPSGEPLRREAAPARMFGASRDGSKVVFGRMLGAVRGEVVAELEIVGQA